jgi:ferredoxin-NADP reductase
LGCHRTARPIKIYMEGPYGRLQVDTEGYQTFLMVSGGIGITPLQSITNELLVSREKGERAIKKVWFVWSAKDRYMVRHMGPTWAC